MNDEWGPKEFSVPPCSQGRGTPNNMHELAEEREHRRLNEHGELKKQIHPPFTSREGRQNH
jgi:hypothetical protein